MFSMKFLIACFLFTRLKQTNAKERSYNFLQRMDGYRIPKDRVQHEYENVGSLMSCMALCNQEWNCAAASYKAEDQTCDLTKTSFSFTSQHKLLTAEEGWILMVKAMFPVYMDLSPNGFYELTLEEGKSLCKAKGTKIATRADLLEAYRLGVSVCNCDWLADGTNAVLVNEQDVKQCMFTALFGHITSCEPHLEKSNVWCLLK